VHKGIHEPQEKGKEEEEVTKYSKKSLKRKVQSPNIRAFVRTCTFYFNNIKKVESPNMGTFLRTQSIF
jgi:hypothetical protein